ncbi:hypothetical protein BGY98DRAFT_318275 [Russula aff. rugulosa BPL654]|nr:hypothetical protein BGY98DRAFT_318275 [Russula aff. rugulosa BPL654]
MTSPRSTLPWRSSQKNRAPTSLSLIVATPEVASPVTSAVAHLPPIKMTGDAKTGSPVVEDVKSQENAEAQPPQDRNDEPQLERVQLEPSPLSNAMHVLPAPHGDPTTPAPEAPDPMSGHTVVPQSRSWFASLSRRGSSNVSLNQLAQKTPAPPPSEQPAVVQSTHSTAAMAVSTTPPPDEHPDNACVIPFVSEPQALAANAGQPESETKLIPRKRAWFAPSSSSALSSKRASKVRPTDEPPSPMDSARKDPPIPETTQPPVMNVIPPTPPKLTLLRSRACLRRKRFLFLYPLLVNGSPPLHHHKPGHPNWRRAQSHHRPVPVRRRVLTLRHPMAKRRNWLLLLPARRQNQFHFP